MRGGADDLAPRLDRRRRVSAGSPIRGLYRGRRADQRTGPSHRPDRDRRRPHRAHRQHRDRPPWPERHVPGDVRVTLPVSPVPIAAQTFAVLLVGGALGFRRGLMAAGLYLVLGLALPVYAGGASGLHTLIGRDAGHWVLGATGGYLLGFVLAAAIVAVWPSWAGTATSGAPWSRCCSATS